MLRKSSFMLGAAACGAMLASCGSSNSTPTPTPTSTATPTPTPTPTATPTPLSFTSDFVTTSGLTYIYAYFTPTGGSETFSDASRPGASGGLNYTVSPESVIFGFSDLPNSVSFPGTTLTAASATLRKYVNGDESLTLEFPYGNAMRASYQRSDSYISATIPGILRSRRVVMFGNSITTTDAISTALSYTGTPEIVGGTPGTTAADDIIVAPLTFNITATTPTVSGTIPVTENVAGVPTVKANLSFSLVLNSSGAFSGTIADTANAFSGAVSGGLAGPNREELVFTFSAANADGRKYVGSFIGN